MKISTTSSIFTRMYILVLLIVQSFVLFGSNHSTMVVPPAIEGSEYTCPGSLETYTITNYDPTTSYVWSLSGGGTIVSSGSGQATVQWGNISGGPFNLSVTGTPLEGIPETGSINVIIEGDVVLVCNDNLNISLGDQCEVLITADVMLEGMILPEDSYTIEVRDKNNILIDPLIDGDYIGQTLEITVIHNCTGNKCWGNVTIEDKIAPVISCQDTVLTCDEYETFIPVAELTQDNCDNSTLEYTSMDSIPDCESEYSLIVKYTWTAEDESGNEAIPCVNYAFILRDSIMNLSMPVNYDGLPGNNPPLSCDEDFPLNENGYPDPSYTGLPGGGNFCAMIEYTYTDVFIPICDLNCGYSFNSYKIIRDWVLVDWCTGEIIKYTQIIKVLDQQAPFIEPMPDITMSVNPFDCSAQIPLPIPDASDNCTDEEFLQVSYQTTVGYVSNGILYIDSPAKTMPGDEVIITVIVEDCCGNQAEEEFELTIIDSTPPVVVADAHDVITLLPSGMTTLYATSLDDGSYDNCGPVGFFVKRMDNGVPCPATDLFPPAGNDNVQYNEVVHFCCDDVVNGPIMVQFQVCDDADMDGIIGSHDDNCNTAMVEVEVQDKLLPVLQCPPNMTVNCNDYYEIDIEDEEELDELFGSPFAAGTCNVEVNQNVIENGVECGEGVIFRTFTATTAGGTATCTQIISIVPDDDAFLTCDRISFVGLNNDIYNWCEVNDNDNDDDDDLPPILIDGCEGFDIAELDINTAGLCTVVGYQVDVDTFTYTGQVCKKYLIHYEVIDQCIFDENYVDPITGQIDPYNSGNGYFEFFLEYNVMDNDAPELMCEDRDIEANTCDGLTDPITLEAIDECTPQEFLVYQWKLDVGNDGTIDFPFVSTQWYQGDAVDPAILGLTELPLGEHRIYWRVSDGCGNVATCTEIINITPYLKAPTPICYNGISIAVMEVSGSVEIWAEDFDKGSFDDCGSPINFTMIPEKEVDNVPDPFLASEPAWTFTCDDITNGVYELLEVRVYVEDSTGQYDYCTTTLKLEDNEANACPDNIQSGEISGKLVYKGGDPMSGIPVTISSDQPEYPMQELTDENGNYSFTSNMFYNYSIGAISPDDYLNGVTTLDIVMIQKHILNIDEITDPYVQIAADVSNDCKISGSDIIQIRKLILGLYDNDELPKVESWRFLTDENVYFDGVQPCNLKENINIPIL